MVSVLVVCAAGTSVARSGSQSRIQGAVDAFDGVAERVVDVVPFLAFGWQALLVLDVDVVQGEVLVGDGLGSELKPVRRSDSPGS